MGDIEKGSGDGKHQTIAEACGDLHEEGLQELFDTCLETSSDGGAIAWLQVLCSWVVLAGTWGLVNIFGVYQAYYEDILLPTTSSSTISWIGSLQASLPLLVGPFSGALYDAGYFRQLLLGGLSLILLGLFTTSLATSFWQLILAQGLCIGVGCGLAYVPSTAILAQYFQRRQALAIGISSTGAPLAGIVFPIIFGRLQSIVGHSWATRIIAFILLGFFALPATFMRTRAPSTRKRRALIDVSTLKDLSFVLFIGGSFCAFLTLYVAFFYTQTFARSTNIGSPSFTPYFVTLLNVGSVPGRVLPPYLADKLGPLNLQIVMVTFAAVLMFGWIGVHDLTGLASFAVLYGMFSGGVVALTPSAIVSMSPDKDRIGSRMGAVFLVAGTAVLIGPPIAGAILADKSKADWHAMQGYGGAALAISAFMYLLTALSRRWKNVS